jgi:hypothetical protein
VNNCCVIDFSWYFCRQKIEGYESFLGEETLSDICLFVHFCGIERVTNSLYDLYCSNADRSGYRGIMGSRRTHRDSVYGATLS